MPSIRSKVIKSSFRLNRLLNDRVSFSNLATKRAAYARAARLFPVARTTQIEPIKGKGFKGEWLTVPQSRTDKVTLYFHGGGFVFDSTKLHRDLVSRIATAAKTRAFSLDYSLAPEHPFPAAVDEALAAYDWLLKHFKPTNIVLAGDSAGGTIALSLLQKIRMQKLPFPACAVVLSPATDAASLDESKQDFKDALITRDNIAFFVDSYFNTTPRDDPIASPVYGAMHGFPPLLIHVDKDELMYPGVARYAAKAKKHGVDVTLYDGQGLWHVWHLFARYVPEARAAIKEIGAFIRAHI